MSLTSSLRRLLPPSPRDVADKVVQEWHGYASPRRVLFVDDDDLICDVMHRLMGRFNCEMLIVKDGKSALAAYHPEQWDLLILDLRLPDMSGIEVFRVVREISPNQPVAIFSGYVDQALIEEVYEVGFAFLARKPSDLSNVKILSTMLRTVGILPKADMQP